MKKMFFIALLGMCTTASFAARKTTSHMSNKVKNNSQAYFGTWIISSCGECWYSSENFTCFRMIIAQACANAACGSDADEFGF